MEEATTLSVPLSQMLALCSGEGAVLMDLWRLCPSTVGSEPKGQNVTPSEERGLVSPCTLSFLPRLQGSTADPRGPPAESLWRAVAW